MSEPQMHQAAESLRSRGLLADLPPGWSWIELGRLAAPEDNAITDGPFGSKLKTEHYRQSGPRVIRLQNIGDGVFKEAKAHISDQHFLSLQRHRVHAGDLVIAILGDALPRACIIPEGIGPAIVKADCIRFHSNEELVLAKYLNYALNFEDTQKRTAAIVHGVGRPRLNLEGVKSIVVPIAPINEQRQIVETLDELLSDLDAAVAAMEHARAKLPLYRASVLKAAVEGSLTAEWRARHPRAEPATKLLKRILAERRRHWEEQRLRSFAAAGKEPPKNWKATYKEPLALDATNLPALPAQWCWVSLDQLSDIAGGVTKGQRLSPGRKTRVVPYLRVANVQRGFLDLREIKEIHALETDIEFLRLKPGDVLFNEGGDRDKLGRGWIWEGQIDECIHQNHVFRARLISSEVQPKLVSWCGNSYGQRWFLRTGKQSVNLASINLTVLRSFPVPLAPAKEQEAIVEAVEDQLSVIDHLEADLDAKLKSAQVLRHAILRQAFTGQLVSQDPNDEPASELLKGIAAEREARVRDAAFAKR